jgi:hypothetical protein
VPKAIALNEHVDVKSFAHLFFHDAQVRPDVAKDARQSVRSDAIAVEVVGGVSTIK